MMEKCKFPEGVTIKPDGVHELDRCEYEISAVYKNVTIEVLRCVRCGHIEISWVRQEDTEKVE